MPIFEVPLFFVVRFSSAHGKDFFACGGSRQRLAARQRLFFL
jgi:hypothetical protein